MSDNVALFNISPAMYGLGSRNGVAVGVLHKAANARSAFTFKASFCAVTLICSYFK